MKLTLRDLFWLVLVCAMGCGWWLNYRETCILHDKVGDLEFLIEDARHWNKALGETTSEMADAIKRKGYIAVGDAKYGMRLEPLDDEPNPSPD